MGDAAIPVDVLNPGQVFACLGVMETVAALRGAVLAGFDWSGPDPVLFRIRTGGDDSPIQSALAFLENCSITSLAPHGSKNTTEKWQVETHPLGEGEPFPIPDPSSPATLPAALTLGETTVVVDHWGDDPRRTHRDNVKFWAGSGGYPGAALLRDALALVRAHPREASTDPFALAVPQSSSFRFDWRRDYIPIDAGFSLNEHADVRPRGYPLVEVFAAIGLSNARPKRDNKLLYRYGVVGRASAGEPLDGAFLPPPLVRAALGCTFSRPFATRKFAMHLGWPGQENQARCITTVTEESTS